METKKKVVALVEPNAENVDAITQKAVIARYAEKHGLHIDWTVGEWAPESGTAGEPEHRDLINDIKSGGVGRLLLLADVKYTVPENLLKECEKAGVKVDYIDVQQEGGLM